jgi:hypothetical protein
MDNRRSEKLTWTFSSGELKSIGSANNAYLSNNNEVFVCSYMVIHVDYIELYTYNKISTKIGINDCEDSMKMMITNSDRCRQLLKKKTERPISSLSKRSNP